jgi:hypothetical protein
MDLSPGSRKLPTTFRAGRIKRSSVVVDISLNLLKNPDRVFSPVNPSKSSNGVLQSFVTGHDFSRADQTNQITRALAPAKLPSTDQLFPQSDQFDF